MVAKEPDTTWVVTREREREGPFMATVLNFLVGPFLLYHLHPIVEQTERDGWGEIH